jgi:hypothetical protein
MSTASATLTTWEEFLQLPDEEEYEKGNHLELHDGEVVVVPPPRSIHQVVPALLAKWFTEAAQGPGHAMTEFFYRRAANLQFWRADGAYLPKADWQALRRARTTSFTRRHSSPKCSRLPTGAPKSNANAWLPFQVALKSSGS